MSEDEQKEAEAEALEQIKDEDIDLSDIPEIVDWSRFRRLTTAQKEWRQQEIDAGRPVPSVLAMLREDSELAFPDHCNRS